MTGAGVPFAVPGDGNAWVVGACWFWCGHRVTLVVRLGAVSTAEPPAEAPLYACGPCVERLHGMVADYAELTGTGSGGGGLYMTPGLSPGKAARRGRHRRPRTVLGRRWLRQAEAAVEEPALPAARSFIHDSRPPATVRAAALHRAVSEPLGDGFYEGRGASWSAGTCGRP